MSPSSRSIGTPIAVFAVLLGLTGATVTVAFLPLGPLNGILALGIAVAKASLVLLYFMHAREGRRRTWIIIGAGVFWLLLLLGLGMSDFLTRSWLPSTARTAGRRTGPPPSPASRKRDRP